MHQIGVNSYCDNVINSGKYSLDANFADNFLPQDGNSPESVFSIEYFKNDCTPLEYLPISQNQINFSKGLYRQNPGW